MTPDLDMRRITEVVGDGGGFHVRFYSPTRESAWFPTRKDGREKALSKAVRYRNKLERELGLTAKDYGARRPRKKHASSKADTGVFPSIGYKRDRFYADVLGVLNYTDEHGKAKRKQKAVSILKHGYHAAYIAALEERCNMAGHEKPIDVVVPKLTDQQIKLLLENGATRRSLIEKAVVPWTGKKA